MIKYTAKNLEDTQKLGYAFAEAVKDKGAFVCLYGDIGAGKTTLTKSIAKHLEVKETVTSPSFVILSEYHSGKLPIYHFDLYRLEEEGVKTILDELREYSEGKVLTLVEWADFSCDELPSDRIELTIEYIEETERNFSFKAFGAKSNLVLENIKL